MENNITTFLRHGKEYVCEPVMLGSFVSSQIGEDPTKYLNPLILLQISLVSSFTALFHILLRPFRPNEVIPQMLGGIVLGPSGLGHNKEFATKFFSAKSNYIIDSYERISFMFFTFLTTAPIDMGMLKRSEKLAFTNGFLLFAFPRFTGWVAQHMVKDKLTKELGPFISMLTSINANSSFQAMFSVLSDLKMLNSEIGRLALSSSMVCNMFEWGFYLLVSNYKAVILLDDIKSIILMQISKVGLVLVICYVCRPIMIWMTNRTQEGRPLKNSYLCVICVMLLFCGFCGEVTGISYLASSVIFGMATPSKPSLMTCLDEKIGFFSRAVFVPFNLLAIGRKVDSFTLHAEDVVYTEVVLIAIQIGKFASVFLPACYYKVPLSHATTLGFVVNIQGLFDIQMIKQAVNFKDLNTEAFTICAIQVVAHSWIFTYLARELYNPASRYIAYKRRTLQHLQPHSRLGIVACFHNQEVVPLILNILDISNPSKESPILVTALDLKELVTESVPNLIELQLGKITSLQSNRRDRIVNAFHQYEKHSEGLVSVNCYMVNGAYTSMHDDVCSMALKQDVNLVLVALDKNDGQLVRQMARNIVDNAPCSVAILYERSRLPDYKSLVVKHLKINVCVLFLGGSNDRETLAYASRMADHPNVNLQILRLVEAERPCSLHELFDRKLDRKMIHQFRTKIVMKQNVEYREERIVKATDLVDALRSISEDCHLVMVGIEHNMNIEALKGLSMWREREELGIIGDLLASSDLGLQASVMVVQQQAQVVEEMMKEHSLLNSRRKSYWKF